MHETGQAEVRLAKGGPSGGPSAPLPPAGAPTARLFPRHATSGHNVVALNLVTGGQSAGVHDSANFSMYKLISEYTQT